MTITVSRLVEHPEVLPIVARWFQGEWPDWYGPGRFGDAERDVQSFANEGSLPVGVVAFSAGEPCGAAALKAESIPSHTHLAPWAAAGFVVPKSLSVNSKLSVRAAANAVAEWTDGSQAD